jgi:hypothetical protein
MNSISMAVDVYLNQRFDLSLKVLINVEKNVEKNVKLPIELNL